MEENLTRYQKIERIGHGTYGVVYKALDTNLGKIVALKKIKINKDDEGVPPTAIREIAVLNELQHPNIVKLLNIVHTREKLFLVFEFLQCDLKKYSENDTISPEKIKFFLHQILQGVLCCHSQRMIHRDLKPQNILVQDGKLVKIADFGLSRAFGIPIGPLTHEVITLWYRAPEILLGSDEYLLPVDMWSVGCIFAELVENKPLFPGDSDIDQIYKIFQALGTPQIKENPFLTNLPYFKPTFPQWKNNLSSKVPSLCKTGLDLLQQFLIYDPAKRITARNALRHPYFSDLNLIN